MSDAYQPPASAPQPDSELGVYARDLATAIDLEIQLATDDERKKMRRTAVAAGLLISTGIACIGIGTHDNATSGESTGQVAEAEQLRYVTDCLQPAKDILAPPKKSTFGIISTGLPLDPNTISSGNMSPQMYDNTLVYVKSLGWVKNTGGKLEANFAATPPNYQDAVLEGLQSPEIRWGLCNLAGGLTLNATLNDVRVNGHYYSKADQVALVFRAESQDDVYQDQRDISYVVTHETGHRLREAILDNATDPDAVALIHKLDEVYADYMRQGVESYRLQYADKMTKQLMDLQHNLDNNPTAELMLDASEKHRLHRAITYLLTQVQKKNGLDKVAVVRDSDPEDKGAAQYRLADVQTMIEQAVRIAVPGNKDYVVSQDTDKALSLFDDTLNDGELSVIAQYMKARMLSDDMLPGSTSGHPQKNSNEYFATSWALTQYVSEDNFDRLLSALPESYRPLAQRQLKLLIKLRQTANVDQLTRY